MSELNIAKYIDHTLLKPDATVEEVKKICREAKTYGFHSVCVNSYHAKTVSDSLRNTKVKTCVVVGFPLGATTTQVKVAESIDAVIDGANEIDMVMNIGALKSKNYDDVELDIREVVSAVKGKTTIIKVIIECCLLTDEEKVKATELIIAAGADFVKTSTGFSTGGATIKDVQILKKAAAGKIKIKASGSIRSKETALEMINAGADRLGSSHGLKIISADE